MLNCKKNTQSLLLDAEDLYSLSKDREEALAIARESDYEQACLEDNAEWLAFE